MAFRVNELESYITTKIFMYPIRNTTPVATTSFDHELLFRQGKLCPEEREHLITQIAPIVTDTMALEDRTYIISRLSFIPQDEREVLIRQVLCLLSDSMSDQDRMFIISRLSFMSGCEREMIVMQALRLIKGDMSAAYRRDIIEGRIQLLHRKYRFRMNSYEIVENPIKILLDIFETLVRNSIELSSYSIEYIDAQTIDDGGLLRSFVAKLTESFCNPKYSLVIESELGAIPTLNIMDSFFLSVEDQEKCFKTIGRFFSAALQQDNSIVLGQNFHPIVFEMIFALNVGDLANIDSQKVFDKMLLIWLLKEGNVEEKLAENIIQDKITKKIRDIYCINSKNEFVKMYGLEEKTKAILTVVRSLYNSLSNKVEWEVLKGTSVSILQEKIQGTISQENVLKALFLDNLDKPEENSVRHIKKWITETNSEGLKKLIEAISGIKTLSNTTKLTVSGVKRMDKLPLFYVCFSRIELSEYTSYEVFKGKLEMSLDYCLRGSGFQMI